MFLCVFNYTYITLDSSLSLSLFLTYLIHSYSHTHTIAIYGISTNVSTVQAGHAIDLIFTSNIRTSYLDLAIDGLRGYPCSGFSDYQDNSCPEDGDVPINLPPSLPSYLFHRLLFVFMTCFNYLQTHSIEFFTRLQILLQVV